MRHNLVRSICVLAVSAALLGLAACEDMNSNRDGTGYNDNGVRTDRGSMNTNNNVGGAGSGNFGSGTGGGTGAGTGSGSTGQGTGAGSSGGMR
jgi:hypothetical protein